MADSLSKVVSDISHGVAPANPAGDAVGGFTGGKAYSWIDRSGMLFSYTAGQVTRVHHKRFTRLEHGLMASITAIVVHQTGGSTAQSAFSQYNNPQSAGAHFLIDKDGTIYQTGSVYQRMDHVGTLKSRCLQELKCAWPGTVDAKGKFHWKKERAWSREETGKDRSKRFPWNSDSIGIELVGLCVKHNPNDPKSDCTYETVSDKQNEALAWLITELSFQLGIPLREVYRHPEISYKHPTEAKTAKLP